MLQVYRELRAPALTAAKMNRGEDSLVVYHGMNNGDGDSTSTVAEIQKLIAEATRLAREKDEKRLACDGGAGDTATTTAESSEKLCCIRDQDFKKPSFLDGDEVIFAEVTNSSTVQSLKIKPCPVHLEGKFFEMSFKLHFNQAGGYTIVSDDTLQLASISMSDDNSDDLEMEIMRARHRLACEPEPPRFVETSRKLESKVDPVDIEGMAALTRQRGCTRFEVAVIAKDIKYTGRCLEIQDEHKTPGFIQSDNDYGDPSIDDELNHLKNPNKPPQFSEDHVEALGLNKILDKLELTEIKTMLMGPLCQVCRKDSPLKCKNCGKVGYCSKEHQKEHWKIHKKNCVLYKIKTNEILGRHLVARCTIQPGKTILKESALVSGPSMGDFIAGNLEFDIKGLVKEEDESAIIKEMGQLTVEEVMHLAGHYYPPKCLGCYMDLKQFPVYSAEKPEPMCPKCTWPLCSLYCGQIENHEMECEYFRENGILYKEVRNEYLLFPRVFIILRCLLLQEKKPELWKTVINLQSNSQLREDWEKRNGMRFHDLYLVRVLKSGFKCAADPNLIRTIIDIVDCNAYYASRRMAEDDRYCESMKRMAGLFEKASFLSHSCIPNAIVVMSPHNHTIEVIAGHVIYKDEPILIDYDYTGNFRSKIEHRDFLMYNYFFNCTCELCADPTEDGLFLNGVICTKCKLKRREGVLAPTDPYNKECQWKCRTCGHERTAASISRVFTDVQKTLSSPDGSYPSLIDKVRDCILYKFNTIVLQAELGAAKITMTEDFQGTCILDDHTIAFVRTALENRLTLLKLFYPDIDKRIVNTRLALCGVSVLEAMSPRCNKISEVKKCMNSCHERLAELTTIFASGVGHECFNQYHAYMFRTFRIGISRMHQVKMKFNALFVQYHQRTTEAVKNWRALNEEEESKLKENQNVLKNENTNGDE